MITENGWISALPPLATVRKIGHVGAAMAELSDVLLSPEKRPQVVQDCIQLVDDEVAAKSGLTGMAVKGGYAIVKKVKPGIIGDAIDSLLDAFVKQLQPFYREFEGSGDRDFGAFLCAQRENVATALLGVTDQRLDGVQNTTIKKAYQKLRPSGVKHVDAAVPGIGRVITRYL